MSATIDYVQPYGMFGAQFMYGQLPGTDRDSVSIIIVGVLSGSLAAAAGKVVFGWVPKNIGAANGPIMVSEDCDCNGTSVSMMSGDMSHIGRPLGDSRKPNTKWHTVGTSNSGTDIRFYTSRGWCRTFSGEGAPDTEGPGCGFD